MAQLVARFHGMEEARGSNPLTSTIYEGGREMAVFLFIFCVKTATVNSGLISLTFSHGRRVANGHTQLIYLYNGDKIF